MRVGAVMMQRNEGDLLRIWLDYHARLFGAGNLFVIDNNSRGKRTRDILDDARSSGVTVTSCADEDFRRKGALVSAMIQSRPDFDWFFPVDCDEFVGVRLGTDFRADRAAIIGELAAADVQGKGVCRVAQAYWNIPFSSGVYPVPMRKVAIKPSEKLELDTGFHLFSRAQGDLVAAERLYVSPLLCFLHFHNRPFKQLVARARLKLRYRVPDFSAQTLQAYKGEGFHLAKYPLMTEDQYMRSLPAAKADISAEFASIGMDIPFSSKPRNRDARRAKRGWFARLMRRLARHR